MGDTAVVREVLEENIQYPMYGEDYKKRPQYSADLIHQRALQWIEQQNPEQIKELANIPVKYLKMPGVADNEWQTVYLQVKVRKGAVCTFAYSLDGKKYTTVGESFTARQGKWIGAKVGVFCVTPNEGNRGWADVDWFRVTK